MAFPDNCTPRLITVDESCGCTLTRSSIKAMTPQDFEDQGFKEIGMDRVIAQTKEARMTGVPQKALMDLLLSRFAPIRSVNMGQQANQSVIAPFIMVPQRHNINANWFVIDAGAATPGAGSGGVHKAAWDLTIKNEASDFSSPLVDLEKYFLPGRYLSVIYKDGSNVGRTIQFKIISAVNANAGGTEKAKVTLEPPYTTAGWDALSAGDKTVYQPTHGLVIPLANSVSNYESWCHQDPAENTRKLLVYWLQTIRETHCFNDEYLKALQAPLTSQYFKQFRQLPLAQQRKRQALLAERAFYNTVFFGQKINEKQTVETYTDLPQVVDPANGGCVLEYKSNTEGIRTQLANCGKITDVAGSNLDMDLVKDTLYKLKRNREIDSGEITTIDAMCDRFTADRLLTLFIDYYKKKYGFSIERFYEPGQALNFQNQVLFNFHKFQFPDEGVELALITDTFFDDYLAAFPTADASMGRFLMMIDWSDVQIGMAGSASVSRQTNVADDLYNSVITPNVKHYQLNSKTIAVMIQDPNRHAIFEDFDANCPSLTVGACTAT